MHHNRIIAAGTIVFNLRGEGQNSRADYLEELMNECLRLRQGLWDVAKICGADTDGNDTPAPLISDIVEFTRAVAVDLRNNYEEAIGVSDHPLLSVDSARRCEQVERGEE